MKLKLIILLVGVAIMLNAEQSLIPELEIFRPYLGTTWLGEFQGTSREMKDVQKWERILNGTHIRIMHSLNDGEYGGESIIYWDEKQKCLAYYYFTTGGFFTHGSLSHQDGSITSHEIVEGNANGITEVKNTTSLLPDGSLHSRSFYLKNGEWIEGHEILYKKVEESDLIFK
jgi:hypothetical protein